MYGEREKQHIGLKRPQGYGRCCREIMSAVVFLVFLEMVKNVPVHVSTALENKVKRSDEAMW